MLAAEHLLLEDAGRIEVALGARAPDAAEARVVEGQGRVGGGEGEDGTFRLEAEDVGVCGGETGCETTDWDDAAGFANDVQFERVSGRETEGEGRGVS